MRKEAVVAAPSMGNKPFAIAAPACTLMMASKTAGKGGKFKSLFLITIQGKISGYKYRTKNTIFIIIMNIILFIHIFTE